MEQSSVNISWPPFSCFAQIKSLVSSLKFASSPSPLERCTLLLIQPQFSLSLVQHPTGQGFHFHNVEFFSIQLGNGEQGTDVRVRNNRLHCQNCYSNDEGKLLLSLFVPTFIFTFPPIIVTFIFRVEVQQSVIATEERKIYTRLALSWTAWVASWTGWATLWSSTKTSSPPNTSHSILIGRYSYRSV